MNLLHKENMHGHNPSPLLSSLMYTCTNVYHKLLAACNNYYDDACAVPTALQVVLDTVPRSWPLQ